MNVHDTHTDGDIFLRSIQGSLFPLHSYTLRTTSGLFRTIFTLPQPRTAAATAAAAPIIIPIYESTSLLTQFLPLITGRPPPKPLHTLDLATLTRLLVLADKWDTPGPITYIRNVINGSHFIDQHGSNAIFPYSPFPSIFSPSAAGEGEGEGEGEEEEEEEGEEEELFEDAHDQVSRSSSAAASGREDKLEALGPLTGFFRTDPVCVYVISRHFRWRAEAERAAVTLLALGEEELERRWMDVKEGRPRRAMYSYLEEELEEEEEELPGDEQPEEEEKSGKEATMLMITNQAWNSLLDLRKRRCARFKELIDSQDRFTAGNNPNYSCIRCGCRLDNSSWTELKRAMMEELESRPLGDTLIAAMSVPARPQDSPSDTGTGAASSSSITTGGRRSDGDPWPELVSCFKAKCPAKGCGASNYDALATVKQIRKCMEELPWRVGWDSGEGVDGYLVRRTT